MTEKKAPEETDADKLSAEWRKLETEAEKITKVEMPRLQQRLQDITAEQNKLIGQGATPGFPDRPKKNKGPK